MCQKLNVRQLVAKLKQPILLDELIGVAKNNFDCRLTRRQFYMTIRDFNVGNKLYNSKEVNLECIK